MIQFTHTIRIYYEDTDAAGIVYHANHLKFMERARTEWLRQLGFTHHQLKTHYEFAFIVRSLAIDYIKPAILDDNLSVTVEVTQAKKVSLFMTQKILKSSDCLCSATLKLAGVNAVSLRPQPFPKELFELFHDSTRTTA